MYKELLQAYTDKMDKEKREQEELINLKKEAEKFGIQVYDPMIYRYKSLGISFTELKRDIEKEIEFKKKVLEDHYRSRFTIAEGYDLLEIRKD